MNDVRMVRCPRCGVPVRYEPANRFRPFCSERCRQIDIGAWAAGDYRVAGEPLSSESDGSGETDRGDKDDDS